jgi:protein-disulfide isomerase
MAGGRAKGAATVSATARRGKIARVRAAEQRRDRRRRGLLAGGAVVAVLLVAGLVGLAVQSARTPSHPVVFPVAATGTDAGIVVGSASAPVTVDFYEDFQCPICGQFEKLTGPTVADLLDTGKIKAVYHMMSFLGPESVRAAGAAAAAANEGRFQQFHDALFAHQPAEHTNGYQDDALVELGRGVGLTSQAFSDAIHDGTYRGYVDKVGDDASRRGVTGTPTVFVNGHQLDQSELVPDGLRAAVTAAAS